MQKFPAVAKKMEKKTLGDTFLLHTVPVDYILYYWLSCNG